MQKNAVSQNSIAILQFKAMSDWHDADDDFRPISNAPLAFPNRHNGRIVLLALVLDGKLQSPKQLRAQIKRPLEFIKNEAWFFAHHRRQQALTPLGCVVAEFSPCHCGRVRLMLRCVSFACQRLTSDTSWAEVVMERVMRGRVKKLKVQVPWGCSGARAVQLLCAALVVPVLACAVCLTRAAGNAGWF